MGVILRTGPGGSTDVIDLPSRLPRAYVAEGARRVAAGRALAEILEGSWDPRREALVEEDFEGEPRPPSGAPLAHAVHGVDYTNNTVTIDVEVSRPCYLVLADASYPGWTVTIDREPARLFTANHLFRGVDLPEGRHSVRFAYRPASLRRGLLLSALGLAALLAAAVTARTREARRR